MPKQTFFNLPDEKRQTIIEIAIEEFAENDYPNVSISRMVARAGIAKGSFYQYFEDKEDLFLYLLDLAAQEKMAYLKGKTPPDPAMNLFAYLKWMMETSVDFNFSNPRLNQVAYRAVFGDFPFKSDSLRRLKEAPHEYYKQLIAMGIAQGDIDPNIDPDTAAFILGVILNELGLYATRRMQIDMRDILETDARQEHWESLQSLYASVIDILQKGLGRKECS